MPNFSGGRTSFGGSTGGTSGKGNAGKGSAGGTGPNAPGGNQYAGYKGPTGTRAPTSAAPGSYGLSGPETRAYNDAKTEYQNRSLGKRIVDFLSPVKSVDPQINQPSSYEGGKYHHGFNPVGLAAGLAAPYGTGTILGPAAGAIYSGMGGHDVVLTGGGSGFSTSFPDGGPGYNSSTGFAGGPGTPGTPQGKGDQSGMAAALIGNPVQSAPGGAPFGAQPTPPAPSPAPGMFTPKIPNHSLPKGYQSMFPNSLTEEDKKLLYAQALMGGA
jgi:hypothetical protein